jgi:arginase family enzyme
MGWWHTGLGDGLSPDRVILVGTRDLDAAEQRHIDDGTLALLPPGADLAERLRDAVAGRPVYVHIDCDVLEPGTVPTDYRVPGGLSLDDLRAAAETLAESELVGLEIAEFESSDHPDEDRRQGAAMLDALSPLLARLGTDTSEPR